MAIRIVWTCSCSCSAVVLAVVLVTKVSVVTVTMTIGKNTTTPCNDITKPAPWRHLGLDEAMEAGGREFSLYGRVVNGVGHPGLDEAMEAGGREFSLHGRGVNGVGHLGHDEAMEAGGHEFEPQPSGHCSWMSFYSNHTTGTVFSSEYAFPSKF